MPYALSCILQMLHAPPPTVWDSFRSSYASSRHRKSGLHSDIILRVQAHRTENQTVTTQAASFIWDEQTKQKHWVQETALKQGHGEHATCACLLCVIYMTCMYAFCTYDLCMWVFIWRSSLSLCMSTCMHACVYVRTIACVCICRHPSKPALGYTHPQWQVRVCMYVHVYVDVCICRHPSKHAHGHTLLRRHMCMCVYVCVCACVCMYMQTSKQHPRRHTWSMIHHSGVCKMLQATKTAVAAPVCMFTSACIDHTLILVPICTHSTVHYLHIKCANQISPARTITHVLSWQCRIFKESVPGRDSKQLGSYVRVYIFWYTYT
jgi:hypothetical protein